MGKLHIYSLVIGTLVLILLMTGSMADVSKGVISVTSTPEGAEIYLTDSTVSEQNLTVNDTVGLTPREFFVDPGNNYQLFVKKYGYITNISPPFTVTPESFQTFSFSLKKQTSQYGAIHIGSNPPGANLTLLRIKDDLTGQIFGNTPVSLESLPPGMYNYTLTMNGYKTAKGSTEILSGNVTEIYVPMIPIPDSALITFKSDPTNAKIVLIGGTTQGANQSLAFQVKDIIANFNGTPEDAVNITQNLLQSQQSLPGRAICGLIGSTPTTMRLNQGYYIYRYYLDGYWMENGVADFNVSVGHDMDVSSKMIPNQQFVQVYFESNVDDFNESEAEDTTEFNSEKVRGPHDDKLLGAVVSINGTVIGKTPGWVSLPSNQFVNVTFDKLPMFAPKTITVDTTLFEGRPSKWGKIIHLNLMDYYITTIDDEHSSISPSGVIEVAAGQTQKFDLTGESPAWLVGNLTVHRDGHNPVVYTYNQSTAVYNLTHILQNATLNLTSVKKRVAVNATAGKGGSVNNGGITYYDYGTESATYNFVADPGYQPLVLWEDGDEKHYYTVQFSSTEMVQNHTLKCFFRPDNVLITPNSSKGGKILDEGKEAVPYWIAYDECTHEHEIVADPGYKCTYYKFTPTDVKSLSSESEKTIIPSQCGVKENLTLNVYFEPLNYTVNSHATAGGFISPVLTNYTAHYGENLSFISSPNTGYKLANISDNGIMKGPLTPYNITVKENHEIIANFQSDVLTITAVAGEGGIIVPNGSVNVTFGNSQCFNITANKDYSISSVMIDGVNGGNISSYCFSNVTTNHNISANFTKFAYTITPNAGVGGSINPNTSQIVPIGGNITFTIIPEGCYKIKDVQVDGASKGNISSYSFTNVSSDHTINASFDMKKFHIRVNQTKGGIIEPKGRHGVVEVNCSSTQCFNMTPGKDSVLYGLLVDNKSVNVENPYCFINITSDHSIQPIFVISPKPDFEANMTRVPPKYPVAFKDFTRDNPTDWLWDFGDGEITNIREPIHYYAETGNYTVTLTAYNAAAPDGVKKVQKNYIEVTKNPIARFTAKPKGGVVPPNIEIELTDNSLNTDGVAYGWVFGDGPKGAISKDALHIYSAPGVYQVTHQVEKPFIAKDYAYETITVLQKPEADFIAHPVSGKAPLKVQFEDRSKGFPTSWLWDFGDDVKSYDQNPVHIYAGSGSYNVSLSVFSDEGSSVSSKDGFITVQ